MKWFLSCFLSQRKLKLQTIHPEVLFSFVVSWGKQCVFSENLLSGSYKGYGLMNSKSEECQGKSELQKLPMV